MEQTLTLMLFVLFGICLGCLAILAMYLTVKFFIEEWRNR